MTDHDPSSTDSPDFVARVRRTVAASRSRVFDAWTDPTLIAQWWAPDGFSEPWAEVDLREGGGFRVGMKNPDGDPVVASGSYRIVRRPERLEYTWRWQGTVFDEMGETTVTVEFSEVGDETEVVLTHVGFMAKDAADMHEMGWGGCVDRALSVAAED